jgi:hypothetical protein
MRTLSPLRKTSRNHASIPNTFCPQTVHSAAKYPLLPSKRTKRSKQRRVICPEFFALLLPAFRLPTYMLTDSAEDASHPPAPRFIASRVCHTRLILAPIYTPCFGWQRGRLRAATRYEDRPARSRVSAFRASAYLFAISSWILLYGLRLTDRRYNAVHIIRL